jgi:orotidine-5'-phosphate decarboxylase
MDRKKLIAEIRRKQSFLCVGLDTDITKIPAFLFDFEDPVAEFNRRIIDATRDLCVSYKINTAFYESRGVAGWKSLVKTWEMLPDECLNIADAKRGDIGNTSEMYAQAFFDLRSSGMSFDAVTVAPYMGSDSVLPFLKTPGKWVILLALTSNAGARDFQFNKFENGAPLFSEVLTRAGEWGNAENMMFVVGATRGEAFAEVRKFVPNHFLLVPGVGAQGGSLAEVCNYGLNADCGLLVNASRSIIYASSGADFAEAARAEASALQQQMAGILEQM